MMTHDEHSLQRTIYDPRRVFSQYCKTQTRTGPRILQYCRQTLELLFYGMTVSTFEHLKVQKVGLLFEPPSILVEYSVSPAFPSEISLNNVSNGFVAKNSLSVRHSILKVEFSGTTDKESFRNSLIEQYPRFFGRQSTVSEDQLNRILSKLLSTSIRKNHSTDEFFEKNRILPNSDDYEYDRRRDFEAPLDESSWDL